MAIALKGYGLSENALKEVLDKQKNGHFQVACGLLFCHSHPGADRDEIQVTRPNYFFEQSMKLSRRGVDQDD
jgi:hypothetical protein